ncbi:hypothetical protein Taro_040126, partial [Colocasia esculenta]|nr:hypothetical protein [Colocasia esculenta]
DPSFTAFPKSPARDQASTAFPPVSSSPPAPVSPSTTLSNSLARNSAFAMPLAVNSSNPSPSPPSRDSAFTASPSLVDSSSCSSNLGKGSGKLAVVSEKKTKGRRVSHHFLADLARRCKACLAVPEFIEEPLQLPDLEYEQSVCFVDDGFGVYEIMDDNDPIEECDEEFEDEADAFASGLKKFDEPTAAVEEITKEPYQELASAYAKLFTKLVFVHIPRHQNLLADALATTGATMNYLGDFGSHIFVLAVSTLAQGRSTLVRDFRRPSCQKREGRSTLVPDSRRPSCQKREGRLKGAFQICFHLQKLQAILSRGRTRESRGIPGEKVDVQGKGADPTEEAEEKKDFWHFRCHQSRASPIEENVHRIPSSLLN